MVCTYPAMPSAPTHSGASHALVVRRGELGSAGHHLPAKRRPETRERRGSMQTHQKSQIQRAAFWTVGITVAHFAINTHSPALHWLHILLAGLFLIPIVICAVAFELKGGLLASAVASPVYLSHLLWSWGDSPMANLDQYAWIGVYSVVGAITGHLVQSSNMRKRQRDEVIARSQRTEMINGITGLLTAVGVRDEATIQHSRRVAELSTAIAEKLGVEAHEVSQLHLAALVHDIGKAGVPDAILFKHGSLDDEQTAAMREHVDIAVGMLGEIPGTEAIARLVSQHHESPDGSGYPRGLTASDIDPTAAVLRVADVFAALTEARPYHEAMTESEALQAMESLRGTKLDEKAFAALHRVLANTTSADESCSGTEPAEGTS